MPVIQKENKKSKPFLSNKIRGVMVAIFIVTLCTTIIHERMQIRFSAPGPGTSGW